MGREGHSYILKNFQSILLSLTIIPRIIPDLLPAPGTQTLAQALLVESCQNNWTLLQLHCHSPTPAQPSAAVVQPLSWIWLGKIQEELPLEGQRGVYSVS